MVEVTRQAGTAHSRECQELRCVSLLYVCVCACAWFRLGASSVMLLPAVRGCIVLLLQLLQFASVFLTSAKTMVDFLLWSAEDDFLLFLLYSLLLFSFYLSAYHYLLPRIVWLSYTIAAAAAAPCCSLGQSYLRLEDMLCYGASVLSRLAQLQRGSNATSKPFADQVFELKPQYQPWPVVTCYQCVYKYQVSEVGQRS